MHIGSLFPLLPDDLTQRIVECLPPNVAACTIRPLNRFAAKHFSNANYTTVRLSQSIPQHAFLREFGPESPAWRRLGLLRRRELVCLVAASGDLPNLKTALKAAGLALSCAVMRAAAKAGQLHVCRWLRRQGCSWDGALWSAAQAGHVNVCEWLLASGSLPCDHALYRTAEAGHVELVWLLVRARTTSTSSPRNASSSGGSAPTSWALHYLAAASAVSGDLAALQQFFAQWRGLLQAEGGRQDHHHQQLQVAGEADGADRRPQEQQVALPAAQVRAILAAAAGSPNPDWRAKVEWLEAQGCQATEEACERVVSLPDAVERLAWLRQRGYPLTGETAQVAAGRGHPAVWRYLVGELGIRLDAGQLDCALLELTNLPEDRSLEILQTLWGQYGALWAFFWEHLQAAAKRGEPLAVLGWLVGALRLSGEDLDRDRMVDRAALCGRVAHLAWFRDLGCGLRASTVESAAEGGCEEVLEWLMEQGCPLPDDGGPYVRAAANGDLATLRCLRRLGCPWGSPSGNNFTRCLNRNAPVAALRWLVAKGCPVDWAAVAEKAKTDVSLDWLVEEGWRQRQGQEQGQGCLE